VTKNPIFVFNPVFESTLSSYSRSGLELLITYRSTSLSEFYSCRTFYPLKKDPDASSQVQSPIISPCRVVMAVAKGEYSRFTRDDIVPARIPATSLDKVKRTEVDCFQLSQPYYTAAPCEMDKIMAY